MSDSVNKIYRGLLGYGYNVELQKVERGNIVVYLVHHLEPFVAPVRLVF